MGFTSFWLFSLFLHRLVVHLYTDRSESNYLHHDLISDMVTLSWHWANQSLSYPITELSTRLGSKREVSIFISHWVILDLDSNSRQEARALPIRLLCLGRGEEVRWVRVWNANYSNPIRHKWFPLRATRHCYTPHPCPTSLLRHSTY